MRFPRVCRGPLESVVGVERSVRNVGDPCHSWLVQVGLSDHKEDGKGGRGSRITPEYSEGGRAVHVGKGVTVGRNPHRQRVPDMQGRSTQANLPEGHSDLPDNWGCGSESHRGARCGKTARRDLCGGRRATGVPTATGLRPGKKPRRLAGVAARRWHTPRVAG